MNPLRRILSTLFITAALLLCAARPALAGDTTLISVIREYQWQTQDRLTRFVGFPDGTHRFERIMMRYRLKYIGYPAGEWDYTTQIFLLQPTGRIDSSIRKAPSFKADGAVVDSLVFSLDTTWTTTYNATTNSSGTEANPPIRLLLFDDETDPWTPTDSMTVWRAGYYDYSYDAEGKKTDSLFIKGDSTRRLTTTDVYVPFEVKERFEIGRLITPYGNWFAPGREFEWLIDVTDYAYLLRDTAEIQAYYDGWSAGALFSLDFELVEGIPAKDVFRVENIYAGGFPYGSADNSIENHLAPKRIHVDPKSTVTTLKITTTGHGFGGTDNAAEFAPKTHTVEVNGTKRFSQFLWREDCGQNPVYPQGGTWYLQRAGWCPGSEVRPDVYDLSPYVTPGDSATLDYNMEPYVNLDPSHGASYYVHAQVIYATGPNFMNDAAIAEIKTPNEAFAYRRMNPICAAGGPVIVIRNNGREPLTKLTIDYGVGEATNRYEWSGDLKFMEKTEVMLPAIDLDGGGAFSAAVSQPNGKDDEYAPNNSMKSTYVLPKVFSGRVLLTLKTDDFPGDPENSNGIVYEVRDLQGNTLHEKRGFTDNTVYRDTFDLPDGCYSFVIRDTTYGDGLFPIVRDAPVGYYVLKDGKGRTIINAGASNFLASFGDREVITFTLSSATDVVDADIPDAAVSIRPNPAGSKFTVGLDPRALQGGRGTVRVYARNGTEVYRQAIDLDTPREFEIDMTGQPAGSYFVQVENGRNVYTERIVITGDGR